MTLVHFFMKICERSGEGLRNIPFLFSFQLGEDFLHNFVFWSMTEHLEVNDSRLDCSLIILSNISYIWLLLVTGLHHSSGLSVCSLLLLQEQNLWLCASTNHAVTGDSNCPTSQVHRSSTFTMNHGQIHEMSKTCFTVMMVKTKRPLSNSNCFVGPCSKQVNFNTNITYLRKLVIEKNVIL